MFVVTLIADPEKHRLTQAAVDSMAQAVAAQGVNWLEPDAACDLIIPSPLDGEGQGGGRQASAPPPTPSLKGRGLENLNAQVQELLNGQPYDAIVQPLAGRQKKLLVADMESTIITCECLDELAELIGIKDKIASITARAMNGELDFIAALAERVALLKGLPDSALEKVYAQKVKLMNGAKELVAVMKKHGAYCMLVSGGFDFFTRRIRDKLGFDEEQSNRLEIDGGRLTGAVIQPILGREAKLKALKDACAKLGIAESEALAVGDGANDVPMLLAAGLGIAFHAKPNVRAQAKAQINHGDLRALLWAQGLPSA